MGSGKHDKNQAQHVSGIDPVETHPFFLRSVRPDGMPGGQSPGILPLVQRGLWGEASAHSWLDSRTIPLVHDPQPPRHDSHDHQREIGIGGDHRAKFLIIDLPQLCVGYGKDRGTARCSLIDQRHLAEDAAGCHGFIDDAAAHDPQAALFDNIKSLSLVPFSKYELAWPD